MAEAFGVAASALSVVSLTLELLKIVKSAHRSVKLMQDILTNTSELEVKLSIIKNLLSEIGALCTDANRDCGVSMCLEQSHARLKALNDIIQDIKETTKLRRREKVKKAFRIISYDQKLSDASGLLRETIDCLSLGLLVIQLRETRRQSINLSTLNQTVSWIAAQQTDEINSLSISNDVQRLTENLSRRLTSLEAAINHGSLSNVKISSGNLVESSDPTTKFDSRQRIKSTKSRTSNDDGFSSKKVQSFPHAAQDAPGILLGHHNGSPFLNATEIYSITHRHLNLLLGTLSIVYMRKRHRRTQKEEGSESILSWEVKVKFSPSWYFDKGLWARLWTNALGGCNVQQSLTVMHTIPSSDPIWNLVRRSDIVSIRKEFVKKKYSVNTVDEYGRSLLGLACRSGQSAFVRFLLDAGAASQGVDDSGRNALLYGFDIGGQCYLGAEYWAIYNLLVERCQLDPSEPDWNGRNFWHLFCENAPFEKDFSWRSISNHFRLIINEFDDHSRTSIFILSSKPRGNIDLFRWHLNNKASISIPQVDGLTCLHAAIASLQPRRETCHIRLEDLTGYPRLGSEHHYGDEDREYQRKRVELLICHGANVFAVSNEYGTPTDIARLTGNFSLWVDALRNSGLDPKRILAADKNISRHRHFLSTLQLARTQRRERRVLWQFFQDIFMAFDSFEENKGSMNEQIIPEWECLPPSPLLMHMGTHEEVFSGLKGVLGSAISKRALIGGKGWSFSVNAGLSGGKYQDGFLDGPRTRLCVVRPSFQEEYNNMDRYLDTLAKVASGDPIINADTVDWKIYRRYVDITKAAAALEWNCGSRLSHVPLRFRSMYTSENADHTMEMPGSWPAE